MNVYMPVPQGPIAPPQREGQVSLSVSYFSFYIDSCSVTVFFSFLSFTHSQVHRWIISVLVDVIGYVDIVRLCFGQPASAGP